MMKDNNIKKFILNFNWMMICFFFLIFVNMVIPSVNSKEMSAKSCYLYPINKNESSPWFTIQSNEDTMVLLEHIPMSMPVNITLKKYGSEDPDLYCLLSIKMSKIDIYGKCIIDDTQHFPLNGSINDKVLVFHVQESLIHVSVDDVMLNLIPSIAEISGMDHEMQEWVDNEDLSEENEMMLMYDNLQYMVQITSNISEENRMHAAFGCEYDTDDECTMEFGRTILSVTDEISLMALSNSSKLDGEVLVHYGNSDFKRSKVLNLTLPNFEDRDTWEKVADIIPSFLSRGEDKGYILSLNSSYDLIYSPRSPGLVGTVEDQELILDFTNTENVRWGVPCPDKPMSLRISTAVITTTPENDAEIFIPNVAEGDEDLMASMVENELLRSNEKINSASQPELENLELQPEPESEPEPEPQPELEGGPESKDGSKIAVADAVTSKASQHVTGGTMSICIQLLILTRSIFFYCIVH